MSKNEKRIVAILSIWSMVHLVVLTFANQMVVNPYSQDNKATFWYGPYLFGEDLEYIDKSYVSKLTGDSVFYMQPSSTYWKVSALNPNNWNKKANSFGWGIEIYDFGEFLIYVGGPWLFFLLYRFLNKPNQSDAKIAP